MLLPTSPLSILILVCYYNRPLWLKNALGSIPDAAAGFERYRVVVLDDGSDIPPECDYEVIRNRDTIEDKIRDGYGLGRLLNSAIAGSTEDVLVTLCDDDALYPGYLPRLERFFRTRPDVFYAYSHIIPYNPSSQAYREASVASGFYNNWTEPIEPYGKIDGSQAAFRLSAFREHGIWYAETSRLPAHDNPWIASPDAGLFQAFCSRFGKIPFTGLIAQYKGIHDYQLVIKKEHFFKSEADILRYHEDIIQKAGKDF